MSKTKLPDKVKWISHKELREKYKVSAKTELNMRRALALEIFTFHSLVFYDDLQVQRVMAEHRKYASKL